jgi:hypothetical protein
VFAEFRLRRKKRKVTTRTVATSTTTEAVTPPAMEAVSCQGLSGMDILGELLADCSGLVAEVLS